MKRFFFLLILLPLVVLAQTRSVLNVGTTANDGTGDSLRAAMQKVNTNFNTLWATVYTNGVTKLGSSIALGSNVTIDGGGNRNFIVDDANVAQLNGVGSTVYGSSSATIQGGSTYVTATTNLFILTPDVFSTTAVVGQVLTLSNATNGESEFGYIEDAKLKSTDTLGNALLRGWAHSTAWQITSATYDSDLVLSNATVRWPDGATGTWQRTTKNATWLTVDAYTITHSSSGKTLTQGLILRDSNGNVTNAPAITVTP